MHPSVLGAWCGIHGLMVFVNGHRLPFILVVLKVSLRGRCLRIRFDVKALRGLASHVPDVAVHVETCNAGGLISIPWLGKAQGL